MRLVTASDKIAGNIIGPPTVTLSQRDRKPKTGLCITERAHLPNFPAAWQYAPRSAALHPHLGCTPGSLIQCDLGRSGSAPISCGIKFLSAPVPFGFTFYCSPLEFVQRLVGDFKSKRSANISQSRASIKNCRSSLGLVWTLDSWAHSAACRKHSRTCSL